MTGRRTGAQTHGRRRAQSAPLGTPLIRALIGGSVLLLLSLGLGAVAMSLSDGSDSPPRAAPGTESPNPSSAPSSAPAPRRKLTGPAPRLIRLPTPRKLDARFADRGLVRLPMADHKELTIRVASYNLLGASHTTGKRARKGYAVAGARLPHQIALMERHGITVAGLQEFQHPQAYQLAQLRGSQYETYPGVSLGEALSQNSIIWRTDTWEAVKRATIGVPYFGGRRVQMPYVALRHKETGRKIWIGNFHNPANIGGNHAGWRQTAVRIEAELALRLGADGSPVFITGDMNDRAEFACPFSKLSGMHSPDGARTVDGSCTTPRQMSVDWVFGSGFVGFADYLQDWSSRDRRLSDHPIIVATATLPGAGKREGCIKARSVRGVERYCPAPKPPS